MNLIIFFIIFILIIFIKIEFNKAIKQKKKQNSNNKKRRTNQKTKYRPKYHKSEYSNLYKNKTKKTTYQENKKKGDDYEKYISEYFKQKGYISYEHGLDKGFKDGGIDLFLKKDNEFLFIQCKNWNSQNKWKMGKKKIIYYQEKARKYMQNNPQISRILINFNYKLKLILISTEDIYTKEAKEYIKENSNILEYKIIPIKK